MSKSVYYAIKRGRSTGIVNTWDECEKAVKGFPRAEFQKFKSQEQANNYLSSESTIQEVEKVKLSCMPSECVESVNRFPGAECKKYSNVADAERYITEGSHPVEVPKRIVLPSSTTPISLTYLQMTAIVRILRGDTLFLSGSGGCGKTFVITVIKNVNKSSPDSVYRRIAFTASTGCAACRFGGQTIHSWAGVGTNLSPSRNGPTLTPLEIFFRMDEAARERWQTVECLLIEEISMISAFEFDRLSQVASIVRRNSAPFGGLQIVVCGDFFQLPPIHTSSYCFLSEAWKQIFPSLNHMIVLNKIIRQKDHDFCELLTQLRWGNITPHIDRILRQKVKDTERDFPESSLSSSNSTAVQLCSLKEYANGINTGRLAALRGGLEQILSDDVDRYNQPLYLKESEALRLRLDKETRALRVLNLKVGAKVMLIRNIDCDQGFVNGAVGTVIGYWRSKDVNTPTDLTVLPVVRFYIQRDDGDDEITLERQHRDAVINSRLPSDNKGYKLLHRMGYEAWNGLGKRNQGIQQPLCTSMEYTCSLGLSIKRSGFVDRVIGVEAFSITNDVDEVIATRKQIPLILAFAITIHKVPCSRRYVQKQNSCSLLYC